MAGQVEPLLALNVEYLKTRQDRRNGWGLGRIYDSAAGAWKLRGTTVRRPFTTQPQNATFEWVHPSLAERRGPNAACVPAPYDCPGLQGINVGAKLAPLGPLEQQLKWTPAQVGPSPSSSRPRPTLLTRLLKDLGGG
jgi:hypothetical protein